MTLYYVTLEKNCNDKGIKGRSTETLAPKLFHVPVNIDQLIGWYLSATFNPQC